MKLLILRKKKKTQIEWHEHDQGEGHWLIFFSWRNAVKKIKTESPHAVYEKFGFALIFRLFFIFWRHKVGRRRWWKWKHQIPCSFFRKTYVDQFYEFDHWKWWRRNILLTSTFAKSKTKWEILQFAQSENDFNNEM